MSYFCPGFHSERRPWPKFLNDASQVQRTVLHIHIFVPVSLDLVHASGITGFNGYLKLDCYLVYDLCEEIE